MSPHVPPSTEVAREHVMRCPCPMCGMYRYVAEAIDSGTPEKRTLVLEGLVGLCEMLVEAILRDVGL